MKINIWNKSFSLRQRIFLSMILLTIFSSILIVIVSVFHFKYEAEEYHEERLSRKENAIKQHIEYILKNTKYSQNSQNTFKIFRHKIFELSDIHGLEVNFFNLNGTLLLSSNTNYYKSKKTVLLKKSLINQLQVSPNKRLVFTRINNKDENIISSYSYIKNKQFQNFAILNIPYVESNEFYNEEINKFIKSYAKVYLIMILISIFLAYIISNTITKSLLQISSKLGYVQLNQRNEKIKFNSKIEELNKIISAYNNMVEKLDESANKLAQSEREYAWREMAKQIAHEVKNPLTPMRLTIQNFQRKFNPTDDKILDKVNDFSETLLHQIDTITDVASAFSNFASMPDMKLEKLELVSLTKKSIEIFQESYIVFNTNNVNIYYNFDKNTWISIVNNLVKNAIQSFEYKEINEKQVEIELVELENEIKFIISDNGCGISKLNQERIFEPKFTTKSSGMGLGLAIIKKAIENNGGSIIVNSIINEGTKFTITLPIENRLILHT